MDDFRRVLERARDRVAVPDLPLEGVYRRRDRRRRNQRIAAGALGIGIALLGLGIGYRIATSEEQPADRRPLGDQSLRTAVFNVGGSLRREIPGPAAGCVRDAAFFRWTPGRVHHQGRIVRSVHDLRRRLPPPRDDDARWDRSANTRRSLEFIDDPVVVPGRARGSRSPRVTAATATSSSSTPPGRTCSDSRGSGHGLVSELVSRRHQDRLRQRRSEALDSADMSVTQEIFTVPASGGALLRLTHDEVSEKQAVYSPDGSRIAVSRGSAGIWIMRADGSHLRRVRGIEATSSALVGLPTGRGSPS